MALTAVGEHAPDFESTTLEGVPLRLERSLDEGPVVLFFLKTGCPATDIAAPIVESIWDEYRDHESAEETRLQVIGVALEGPETAASLRAAHGLTFPVVVDDAGAVAARFGVATTPTLLLLRGRERLRVDSDEVAPEEGYRCLDRVIGWSKRDVERLSDQIAARIGALPPDLFSGRLGVPDVLPG